MTQKTLMALLANFSLLYFPITILTGCYTNKKHPTLSTKPNKIPTPTKIFSADKTRNIMEEENEMANVSSTAGVLPPGSYIDSENKIESIPYKKEISIPITIPTKHTTNTSPSAHIPTPTQIAHTAQCPIGTKVELAPEKETKQGLVAPDAPYTKVFHTLHNATSTILQTATQAATTLFNTVFSKKEANNAQNPNESSIEDNPYLTDDEDYLTDDEDPYLTDDEDPHKK